VPSESSRRCKALPNVSRDESWSVRPLNIGEQGGVCSRQQKNCSHQIPSLLSSSACRDRTMEPNSPGESCVCLRRNFCTGRDACHVILCSHSLRESAADTTIEICCWCVCLEHQCNNCKLMPRHCECIVLIWDVCVNKSYHILSVLSKLSESLAQLCVLNFRERNRMVETQHWWFSLSEWWVSEW
jgi:hypothetical protein